MIVGADQVQICEFRDPFGNRVELIKAFPQTPQFTKENRDGSAGNQ
jgi:hypothetical protein